MEFSNTVFIKELVHRGDCVSLLVRETAEAGLAGGKLAAIPLIEENIYLDVSICYLAD
jgi:hypothetical protein